MNMKLKKAAICLIVLTICMGLFGCELVSVNTERDNAQAIVVVGDKTYTKALVNGMINSQFSLYGIEDFASSQYDQYRTSMGEQFATQKAVQYYAVQNGYRDKLTEDDYKEIEESMKEITEYYNTEIEQEVKEDLGYTDEEGAPEYDDAAKEVVAKRVSKRQEEYLLTMGTTSLDEYKEELINQAAADAYLKTIEDAVTVSDEEIKSKYDSLVSEQKTSYDADPSAYTDDVEGGEKTVVYTPAGFRRIKHVLVKIDDETAEKIKALESEIEALEDGEEKTNKQSELDILSTDAFGKIEAKAREVETKAKAGTNFDSLIKDYGEDEGTAQNPDGYLLHDKITDKYEAEFQDAGMNLAKVGDISGLVKTGYGYHVLQYASDVESKTEDFETVKEAIKADLLESKQEKAVEEKQTSILDNYKADGTVKVYLDRLKIASVPGK